MHQKKKEELGLTEDDIMILSVGELNQNKNQEVVIKAIAKLNNPKVHYVIAGKGDKDQYLMELAKESRVHLHLLGYRTDIIELLNAADVFAFPSFREGLSVALMEAMAAGLPCVVSEIRGNTDLISNGKGGYLCDPNEAETFYTGLLELEDAEKRNKFGSYNRQTMKNFDAEKIMELMTEIYK